jgi:hypothetical protein
MNDPVSVKAKESTFKDVIVCALGSTTVYDLAKVYRVKDIVQRKKRGV